MILDWLAKAWLATLSFAIASGAVLGFLYWLTHDPDAPGIVGMAVFTIITLLALIRTGFFDGPGNNSVDPY